MRIASKHRSFTKINKIAHNICLTTKPAYLTHLSQSTESFACARIHLPVNRTASGFQHASSAQSDCPFSEFAAQRFYLQSSTEVGSVIVNLSNGQVTAGTQVLYSSGNQVLGYWVKQHSSSRVVLKFIATWILN